MLNAAFWFQDLARVVPLTAARFCNYQLGTHCAKQTCPHWNAGWKNNHLQTPTLCILKCTQWHYCITYCEYVWLCVPVLSVCECTSLNTCCEMCICAFLDFCQETCYVDITLCIAVISRWQHEKRWAFFMQMAMRMKTGQTRAETRKTALIRYTGIYWMSEVLR